MKKFFLLAGILSITAYTSQANEITPAVKSTKTALISTTKPAAVSKPTEELQCTSLAVCGDQHVLCYYNNDEFWMELEWAVDDSCH
jgi:hypothetical protein